jgi:DNA-binding FadR family transcriptional regulator
MSALPQVGRDKLADQVARLLEQRILGGEWHSGHSLPAEHELASQLAVSRTVVRDAVKTLVARGLVNVRQGVGTTVAEPSDGAYSDAIFLLLLRSDATVREVLEARELIEVAVVGMAAARRTADDCARLERSLEEFTDAAAAVDWPRGSTAHLDFHLGILDAVRSPVLRVLLRPMQQIVLATGYGPVVEDDPENWNVKAHWDILDAIRAGEEAGARRAMTTHFAFRADASYADYHATRFCDAPTIRAELHRRSGPPA